MPSNAPACAEAMSGTRSNEPLSPARIITPTSLELKPTSFAVTD